MIREILEEPSTIRKTLIEEQENIRRIAGEIKAKNYEMAYITGSGTSYHAGLASQYVLSSLTDLITSTIPASEFQQWASSSISRKTFLIAISQSGESIDILDAAKAALKKGMDVLAVTSNFRSTLARLANYTIFPRSGEENAVPATKTYVTQLMAIFMFALELAEFKRYSAKIEGLREKLYTIPQIIEETFETFGKPIREIARKYKDRNLIFILGSGPNYATSLEAALKLKETCMVFAEGFATREFLHGPIRLVDKRTLIIIISPKDEVNGHLGISKSFKGFGASVISILERTEESKPLAEISDDVLYVPSSLPKIFSPIIFIVPIQLFAYYVAVFKGLNPDRPEKLMKVVK